MSLNPFFHSCFCVNKNQLFQWYDQKNKSLHHSFYSSYDLRDSGYKVSLVDANIFPGGFNNICEKDFESSIEIVRHFFIKHYAHSNIQRIMLLTEAHTHNLFYWDNVYTLKELLMKAGIKVLVGIPKRFDGEWTMNTSKGNTIVAVSAYFDNSFVKEFNPQLIISNNDFSEALEDWYSGVNVSVIPPRKMGWHWRRKNIFFDHYNKMSTEFAHILKHDPFNYTIKTELFSHFDVSSKSSLEELAHRTDQFIHQLRRDYTDRGIQDSPFVFIKNNAGTYGLAVHKVESGKEILEWNYNSRKKMKAAKGNQEVHEVIIQEGIATRMHHDGVVAEPVIYMIDEDLSGGFLRAHERKTQKESLNAVGAIYKRLCISDLFMKSDVLPFENVYGWIARLGFLSIGMEMESIQKSETLEKSQNEKLL